MPKPTYFAMVTTGLEDVELTILRTDGPREEAEEVEVIFRGRMLPSIAPLIISTLAEATPLIPSIIVEHDPVLCLRLTRLGVATIDPQSRLQ